jgi:hypothetical protein
MGDSVYRLCAELLSIATLHFAYQPLATAARTLTHACNEMVTYTHLYARVSASDN